MASDALEILDKHQARMRGEAQQRKDIIEQHYPDIIDEVYAWRKSFTSARLGAIKSSALTWEPADFSGWTDGVTADVFLENSRADREARGLVEAPKVKRTKTSMPQDRPLAR